MSYERAMTMVMMMSAILSGDGHQNDEDDCSGKCKRPLRRPDKWPRHDLFLQSDPRDGSSSPS